MREKCLRLFLFAGTYLCGSLEKSQKSQKLEPAKISCHTVKPNQSDSDSTYTISVTSLRQGQQKVTIMQKKTNKQTETGHELVFISGPLPNYSQTSLYGHPVYTDSF